MSRENNSTNTENEPGTFENLKQGVTESLETLKSGAQRTGEKIMEGATYVKETVIPPKTTGEKIADSADRAGERLKENTAWTGQQVGKGVDNLAESANRTGEQFREGAQRTRENFVDSANRTGEYMRETHDQFADSAARTGEQMKDATQRCFSREVESPPKEKTMGEKITDGATWTADKISEGVEHKHDEFKHAMKLDKPQEKERAPSPPQTAFIWGNTVTMTSDNANPDNSNSENQDTFGLNRMKVNATGTYENLKQGAAQTLDTLSQGAAFVKDKTVRTTKGLLHMVPGMEEALMSGKDRTYVSDPRSYGMFEEPFCDGRPHEPLQLHRESIR